MSYRDSDQPDPSWQDDEYRDILAGEYVLGTMEERDLVQFIKHLHYDHDLRQRVRRWEERLQPLADAIDPIEPPNYIWRNIVASIADTGRQHRARSGDDMLRARQHRARPNRSGHHRTRQYKKQLMRWRVATAVACAACIGAFSMLWFQQVGKPSAFDAISVVSNEGVTLWVVDASIDDKVLKITAVEPPEVASNQVHELWMVKPDDGGVVSLGLLPQDGRTSIIINRSVIEASAIALAVSLEPSGGSTQSIPTGPVLYQGEFSLVNVTNR